MESDSRFLTTTEPAPILTLSPIVIAPMMTVLEPMSTLSPILVNRNIHRLELFVPDGRVVAQGAVRSDDGVIVDD